MPSRDGSTLENLTTIHQPLRFVIEQTPTSSSEVLNRRVFTLPAG
jgi:hypothetical protein